MGKNQKGLRITFLGSKASIKILFLLYFLLLNQAHSFAADINTLTDLTNAISASGSNSYTIKNNITLSSSPLGAITGTSLTIAGSNIYSLNGNSKAGMSTSAATQSLTISNYGQLNVDGTVATSINSFSKTSNGSFISSSGPLNLSSNIFYSNTASTSTTSTALSIYGGAVYETLSLSATNDSAVSVDSNSFFTNKVSGTNTTSITTADNTVTSYGGALATVLTESGSSKSLTETITGNTFGNNTTGYGNVSEAISNTTTTTRKSTATAQGGAFYNSSTVSGAGSSVTLNVNSSNTFTANEAIANNTSQPSTGATASVTYGGAIANSETLSTTNTSANTAINSNTFKTNSAEAINNSKITSSGAADATSQGGAIYNYATISANVTASATNLTINNNTFGGDSSSDGNSAKATNSSLAPSGAVTATAIGGAVYSEISAAASRNITSNDVDINYNNFKNNSSYSIIQDNSTITAGTTTSTGNKTSTAQGGAIATKIAFSSTAAPSNTTTDIKGNTFGTSSSDSNTAEAYNETTTSTTGATAATAQGGAVYNYVNLVSGNSSEINIGRTKLSSSATTGDTNSSAVDDATSDNTFYYNKAYAENSSKTASTAAAAGGATSATAQGGGIYNTFTTNGTNTINVKYNTFSNESAESKNISTTSTATAYAAGATNSASYGGAIYSTSTVQTVGANTVNVFNDKFYNNLATSTNNSTSKTTSTGATGATDVKAYGGAVYNYATNTGTTANNTFDVENNQFGNSSSTGNQASASNTSLSTSGAYTATANGGAIYNELLSATTASTKNYATINSNIFKNNKASGSISDNTTTTSTTGSKTVTAAGGAVYNKASLTGSNVGITISMLDNTFGSATDDGNTLSASNSNKTTTTGTTSVTAYGGAIYNNVALSNNNTAQIDIGSSGHKNTFSYNSLSASNTGTSSNTANSAPGATVAYGYGGAIYNSVSLTGAGSSTANINYNTYDNNSLTTENGSDTTSSASNGYTYAYTKGGVIHNALSSTSTSSTVNSNSVDIDNSTFTANTITTTNSSKTGTSGRTYAYTHGGIIFNTLTASGTGANSNTVTVSGNTFGGDTAAEKNTIKVQNTSQTSANAYSYLYGGILANVLNAAGTSSNSSTNTINIINNNFKSNTISLTNTSTSSTKTIESYGGVIYNDFDATNIGTSSNTVNITDNIFSSNSATYGGAIYNDFNQTGTGTNTNTINIKGTGLTTSKFSDNNATQGGAIYNYANVTSAGNDNSYTDINIQKTPFSKNNSTTLGGAIYNNFATSTNGNFKASMEIDSDSDFDSNYVSGTTNARGGAINDTLSAIDTTGTATSYTGATKLTSTINCDVTKNYAKTNNAGSSTAYGGGVFNSITTTASASSTGSASATTNLSNTFSGSSLSENYVSSSSTGNTTSYTADARGGGLYTDSTLTGSTTSTTSTVTAGSYTTISNSLDGCTIEKNKATADAVSIATAYGGGIYNSYSTTVSTNRASQPTSDTTATLSITNNTSFNENKAIASSTGTSATSLYATASGGAIYNYLITSASTSSTGAASATPTLDVTISNSSFEKNYASASAKSTASAYGGTIYNYSKVTATETTSNTVTGSADLTTTISNTSFKTNYASANSNGNLTSSTATAYGGAIYNLSSAFTKGVSDTPLTINNTSTFDGNYAKAESTNCTATAYGGAIYNANDTTSTGTATSNLNITDTTFKNNYVRASALGTLSTTAATAYGGAIYNSKQATITGSNFENNKSLITGNSATTYAQGYGGAIYNSGTMTITDTSFSNNSADTLGGAIYNTGTLYIVDDNKTTTFSDNKANSISNAIYLAGGSVYLNAGSNGSITFKDKIASSAIGNTIYINKTDVGQVYGGDVIFNNTVSDSTMNLYGGKLTFGSTGSTLATNYLSNVKLYLQGGSLNLENGLATDTLNLNTFYSASGTSLYLDADLSNNQNDTITAATASGILDIAHLRIINDGNDSNLTIFTGGISPTLTAFNIYTPNYKYIFTPSTAGSYSIRRASLGGLNYAIEDSSTYRSFSATNSTNADYNLGAMAGVGSTLDIFGNNNSINGLGYSGVNVLAGQTLNISGVGALNEDNSIKTSFNDFSSTNGGLINNSGTVGITNSVLCNNNATSGGVIYNNSSATVTDSTLAGNNAVDGGAIYNNTSGNLTTNNSTLKNNSATSGGAIYNKGLATTSGLTFSTNTASNGGAVYNTSSFLSSKDSFTNNKAGTTLVSGNGGAIYNTGNATLTGSTFSNNSATDLGGAIYNTGTVNLIADSNNITFKGNTDSTGNNAIYLTSGSTLNLNTGNNSNITFNDKINSVSNSGNININKTGVLESDGITAAPTTGTVYVNNSISNSTINLYNGTLAVAQENYLNGNNLSLNGGTLSLINGSTGTAALNNLNLAAGTTTNLGIDMDLVNSTSDKITANTYSGTGRINISDIRLLNDKTGTSGMPIIDNTYGNMITSNVTSAWGPIFKYNLNYNPTTGMMTASTISGGDYTDFNPTVLSKTISSLTGTYLNQLSTYSESLGRAEIFMSLPATERVLLKYQNRYAYTGDEPMVFSPTFLPESSGGLWFKQYCSFENIPLINGPNVSNVSYGTLIGGDTPLEHLRHGYDGYLTMYVGYNGSHQNYSNVGINQNGGLVGITGTVYKGNFFAALTGTVGESSGSASNPYGNDYFNTVIAGAAAKVGYNFEFMGGKIIVQPSYSMAYTFANTFDYVTSQGAKITSLPLNAIQISPGIKIISNLKNGWQPYIGVNMIWNLMDNQKFYANDVPLPEMSIAPYVEYGVGLQRKWGERFTGFVQTMFRGGGRNGLALQFGLRFALGK